MRYLIGIIALFASSAMAEWSEPMVNSHGVSVTLTTTYEGNDFGYICDNAGCSPVFVSENIECGDPGVRLPILVTVEGGQLAGVAHVTAECGTHRTHKGYFKLYPEGGDSEDFSAAIAQGEKVTIIIPLASGTIFVDRASLYGSQSAMRKVWQLAQQERRSFIPRNENATGEF